MIFNIEYDSIKAIHWYTFSEDSYMTFLCSKDGVTYVMDEHKRHCRVLNYEEVNPYVEPLRGQTYYSFVKKNGLLGMIKGVLCPNILVECEYDFLEVMTMGDKYIYMIGCKKNRKFVIVCPIKHSEHMKVFEIDLTVI